VSTTTASTPATAAIAPRARAGHAVAYEGFVLGLRFKVVMVLGLCLRLLDGVGAAGGSGFLYRKHGSKSENPNASKAGCED